MIVIHLAVGIIFGVTSVLYSIYADHSFLTGLLRYSGTGVFGMCLSALLSWIPPFLNKAPRPGYRPAPIRGLNEEPAL